MAYHKQVKDIRKRNKEKFGNVLESDEFLCGFRRNDRLYPVYTLVLYWGEKEWDAPDSLQDMVEIPADDVNLESRLKDFLPDYRIHVYDLNKVKDFSAFKTSLRTLFEFYSRRKDGKELKSYMKKHEEEIGKLDSESRFLLATMIDEKQLTKQLLKKTEGKSDKEEENVCKAIQELIEEGRQEGKIEGKIEAIIELLTELGEVDNNIKERISKENDACTLRRWHKLAAKSKSIDDFANVM